MLKSPMESPCLAPYTVVDLFAGCGGLTLGFEQTGRFRSVLAVESDADAADTYRANFDCAVAVRLIEDIEVFPHADVVIGGPPCQGFSPLNRDGVGFERRSLWREYLRALETIRPFAFVMENVPQLLKSAEYADFARAAEELGYRLEGRVLNAADYGVPQTRRRAIVIGCSTGRVPWPDPTHVAPGHLSGLPEWSTFGDAVTTPTPLPEEPDGLNWHVGRNPRPLSLERYRTIPREGEGRFELAARRPDITPPCWLRKKTGTTDVFGRLWWNRPAYTIRTEFYKPEKGRYLHPRAHRPITVREAARLMTFPDDFVFLEDQPMTSVAKQVGNAVPPLLARSIAVTVEGLLSVAIRGSAAA
jgi:DNA (cytosine-5)-methyltransferase 1